IVVSHLRTDVPAGDRVAPQLFGYGKGRLSYDPYFNRWSFTGYRRSVAVTGTLQHATVRGTMIVTDRIAAMTSPQGWWALALAGRPETISTLEGEFSSDLRYMLDADITDDPRLHGQTTIAYNFTGLPTIDAVDDRDECAALDGYTGEWPTGDAAL